MLTTNKLGWAVMGTGTIATEYMVTAIRALGHDPRWVVSRNKNFAKFFSEDTGISNIATDASQALADPDVRFVYVSAACRRRRSYILAACEARKHILCDGPIAPTSKGAAELVAACSDARISLRVHKMHRASTIHLTMRRLVREGEIGKLHSIQIIRGAPFHAPANRRMTEECRDGDIFLDVAVNDIDLARFLSGEEPQYVFASPSSEEEAAPPYHEVSYSLKLTGDIMFQAFESFRIAEIESMVMLLGEHGSLVAHGTLNEKSSATLMRRVGNRNELTPVRDIDCYYTAADQFIKSVRTSPDWLATGEDCDQSLRSVEAIKEAIRKKRIVYL